MSYAILPKGTRCFICGASDLVSAAWLRRDGVIRGHICGHHTVAETVLFPGSLDGERIQVSLELYREDEDKRGTGGGR